MSENNNRDLMPYNLFLIDDRILAQNIDGNIVDIGATQEQGGGFHWRLDGKEAKGEFLPSAEAVLDDIEQHLSFLFLDGQFTSLPDVSEAYADRLENIPLREITLHELRDDDQEEVR